MNAMWIPMMAVWAMSIICTLPIHDTPKIIFDVVMFASMVFVLKNMHLLIAALPFAPLPFDETPVIRQRTVSVVRPVLREYSKPDSSGYVYLLKEINGTHYKIGRASNPQDRLRTFNVKLPYQVEYVCLIPTIDMYALERQLHRQYSEKRVNGEWFALSDEDIASIIALAQEAQG